jgi:hypothetical protein
MKKGADQGDIIDFVKKGFPGGQGAAAPGMFPSPPGSGPGAGPGVGNGGGIATVPGPETGVVAGAGAPGPSEPGPGPVGVAIVAGVVVGGTRAARLSRTTQGSPNRAARPSASAAQSDRVAAATAAGAPARPASRLFEPTASSSARVTQGADAAFTSGGAGATASLPVFSFCTYVPAHTRRILLPGHISELKTLS